MGLMLGVLDLLFGSNRNVLKETAEVFLENSEAGAARDFETRSAALAQFGDEFLSADRGVFDRVMDSLNRLPRPFMALGCIGLFVSAMVNPVWFASRMQGIALVPEPLWWLLGVVVSFYFGARHQAKGQEFQRSMAQSVGRTAAVIRNLDALNAVNEAYDPAQTQNADENAALNAWRRAKS